MDESEANELSKIFESAMAEALHHQSYDDVRSEIEQKNDSPSYILIQTSTILVLAKEFDIHWKEVEQIHQKAFEHTAEPVRGAKERVTEILTFDCRIPHPINNPDYSSEGRYLFMLGEYWDLYIFMMSQNTHLPIGFNPHPLLKFTVNLKARINTYLSELGDRDLDISFGDVFQFRIDDIDALDLWDEMVSPKISEAQEQLETAQMKMKSRRYDLTEAERLFIDTSRIATEQYIEDVSLKWNKIIKRLEKRSKESSPLSMDRNATTCFEYIRKVETTLRDLAKSRYRDKFGPSWILEVKQTIGEELFEKANSTRLQRGSREAEDILDFTQLKDVFELVSQQWNLFVSEIKLKRKEFNQLMSVIMKGRTEEAHHRPEKYWTEIEQQRARVACDDLLRNINKDT